jgi:hypothetical protein
MTTTEEPINQASQQARHGESVKHLPERLSRRNRNRVPKLSSSYRNPMVKHEPELHTQDQRLSSSGTRLTDEFRYVLDMINIMFGVGWFRAAAILRRVTGSGSMLGR